MEKRAGAIRRVSEDDQKRGNGPEVQSNFLARYCVDAGIAVKEDILVDERATVLHRPEFEAAIERMIELKRRGIIDAVVFPMRSRLGRKGSPAGHFLYELEIAGIEVHFAFEKRIYRPDDPDSFGWVMRGLEQAHSEADEMRARTVEARRVRAVGGMMPSGKDKYAYQYYHWRKGMPRGQNSGRYTKRLERVAHVIQWVAWILGERCSQNKVAKRHYEKTREYICARTIRNVLSDPIVIGRVVAYTRKTITDLQGKKRRVSMPESEWVDVYRDPTLAIITEEQFYALRRRWQLNKRNAARNCKYQYPPLRGKVKCLCSGQGHAMHNQTRGANKQLTYLFCKVCGKYVNSSRLYDRLKEHIKIDLLEPDRLIPQVKKQLTDGTSASELEARLSAKRDELKALDKTEDKLVLLYARMPDYPVYKLDARREEVMAAKRNVMADINSIMSQLEMVKKAMADKEGIILFCQFAAQNLDSLTDNQWGLLFDTMKLQVLKEGDRLIVRVDLPTMGEHDREIVLTSSQGFAHNVKGLPYEFSLASNSAGALL